MINGHSMKRKRNQIKNFRYLSSSDHFLQWIFPTFLQAYLNAFGREGGERLRWYEQCGHKVKHSLTYSSSGELSSFDGFYLFFECRDLFGLLVHDRCWDIQQP